MCACVHVYVCVCVCVRVCSLCRSAGARPSANTSANARHAKNARALTPCVGAQRCARMVARNLAARRALAVAPAFVHMDGSAATARLFSFLSSPLVFSATLSCFCCVFPHVPLRWACGGEAQRANAAVRCSRKEPTPHGVIGLSGSRRQTEIRLDTCASLFSIFALFLNCFPSSAVRSLSMVPCRGCVFSGLCIIQI